MPVIRGRSSTRPLMAERRAKLKGRLRRELDGEGAPGGPLIYEIPLKQSDKLDVMVVWDEFEGVSVEDRDEIILDAYRDRHDRISMAMGVTWREVSEQNLLPYMVISNTEYLQHLGEGSSVPPIDTSELREAKLREGGIERGDGVILLQFPTRVMAEEAQARLAARLPLAGWSVMTQLDPIP